MSWSDMLCASDHGKCDNLFIITHDVDGAEKPSAAREQVHNTLRFARRAMTADEMAEACAISLRHAYAHLDSLVGDGLAAYSGGPYSLAQVRPRRR